MTIRFGMVATGRIADQSLAPAIAQAEGAALWSVYSRDGARAEDFAKRHGAASPRPAHDDLDAMLADPELDAVVLASPDKLHAPQAIAAAKAGKHVLTEKPMATSRAEGEAMVAACAEAGVRLGIAYHLRWHDGHRKLNALVRDGHFGTLRHMRLQWAMQVMDDSNWRAKTQVGRWWSLAAVGTHCLDQLRWFMRPQQGEVADVACLTTNAGYSSPRDETAVAALTFEGGATGEICTSMIFEGPRRMEIYGTKGYAICEGTLGPDGGGTIVTDKGRFDFEQRNPYVGEIEDFVQAIVQGRDPEVAGPEGLRNVDLLLKAVGEGIG